MTLDTPIWNEGLAPLALPALTGDVHPDVHADVCVVGLGGSGLACVHALLDHGARVVGLDARTVASGAAGRNGGFLLAGLAMFHHDAAARFGHAAARAVYRATLAEIDRMAAETPDAIRRTGTLRIATTDAERADCAHHYEAMRADELPVERYAGPEGEGLLFPADAAFDPARRCRALAAAALARGAALFERSEACEIDHSGVRTAGGVVHARAVVVAVDGGLDRLMPELAGRVRSARLQMLATAPLSDTRFPRPVYARWGLDYWQQRADGRVALGGCRDVGGAAEWTTDASPTPAVQEALDRILRARLAVTAPVTHRWAAIVAYTPSGLPILEEVRPGVWVAGAYSGTGNVIGALCGRAAAELALNRPSPLVDLFRP